LAICRLKPIASLDIYPNVVFLTGEIQSETQRLRIGMRHFVSQLAEASAGDNLSDM